MDIPLLLENRINKKKDIIIFIEAKKKEIKKRLKKRPNFNLKIFNRLTKCQISLEIKKRRSNFIIKNNFNNRTIEKNINVLLAKILKK